MPRGFKAGRFSAVGIVAPAGPFFRVPAQGRRRDKRKFETIGVDAFLVTFLARKKSPSRWKPWTIRIGIHFIFQIAPAHSTKNMNFLIPKGDLFD
jgi:hypothetical protein